MANVGMSSANAVSSAPAVPLTISDVLSPEAIYKAALAISVKIAYDQKKGYTECAQGHTFWDSGYKYAKHCKKIYSLLKKQKFHFSPVRKITRRTKSGKIRDFYISSWSDKIVEKWLNDSLNIKLHNYFSKHSYAYRIDDLGLDSCQIHIKKYVSLGKSIVKRDISKYFYSIDHDILLKKLAALVDPNDYLYRLISERIKFLYIEADQRTLATVGIPFGSSLACSLANIVLTDLDHKVSKLPIKYFRYADDFLVIGEEPHISEAAAMIDKEIIDLKLTSNPKHSIHILLDGATRFKHLGLEYNGKTIRLPVEKQRKILNFFKNGLDREKYQLKKIRDVDDRLKFVINNIKNTIEDRVRSVAIIDYYLKHVNDELQLKVIDRLLAELTIATVLNKRFRQSHFSIIPYKKLRTSGLPSLLHRRRLHAHGHIKSNFLSLYNELKFKRYMDMIERRQQRINQIKLSKKLNKLNP